ncbi:hypothetical protein [Nonomuraea sp. NPDC049758]|uniref:hypothetical protein n=1 Tax=Nonomuraea sp. NPDC049758 TaxID=3154360 RepID=UPI003433AFE3
MKYERLRTDDDFAQARFVMQAALSQSAQAPAIRHPNGFTKIPLSASADKRRLFLHVWENPASDSQIHDHRWGFTSIVLAGHLVNTTYNLEPCVSGMSDMRGAHIATYSSDGATFALEPAGGSAVVPVVRARVTLSRGEQYSQEPTELHRVAAAAGTVTFVARDRHVKPVARVLIARDGGPSREDFTRVAPAERDALIRSVLQQIT